MSLIFPLRSLEEKRGIDLKTPLEEEIPSSAFFSNSKVLYCKMGKVLNCKILMEFWDFNVALPTLHPLKKKF